MGYLGELQEEKGTEKACSKRGFGGEEARGQRRAGGAAADQKLGSVFEGTGSGEVVQQGDDFAGGITTVTDGIFGIR